MASQKPAKPPFATPLPQSPRSEVLEWSFPRPYHQWTLTGRSRAAWHTSFVIPQLNLLLDAGLCVNKLRPKHIFITHGHSDHTLLSPAFAKRDDPPDVFCPAEMATKFDDFILADTMLNLGGLVGIEDAEAQGLRVDDDHAANNETPTASSEVRRSRTSAERAWLATHVTHGVRPGDVVPLRRCRGMSAAVFRCDHTVPCVGYVFRSTTDKLKPELAGLPGTEIRDMRRSGVQVTAARTVPVFAFLGDTTAATLAAEPEWLRDGIPVVITECSFLYEEHRAQAAKTKHTFWPDLEPVVRKWPKTTFVLIHFSMRYTDREVAAFFRQMPDPPANIVVWADGQSEE